MKTFLIINTLILWIITIKEILFKIIIKIQRDENNNAYGFKIIKLKEKRGVLNNQGMVIFHLIWREKNNK